MTPADLRTLPATPEPPNLTAALLALAADARGDWPRAHQYAQDDTTAAGAWVHAYLHRKEGDLGNAAYWYRRAHRPTATGDLAAEWTQIAEELLRSGTGLRGGT